VDRREELFALVAEEGGDEKRNTQEAGLVFQGAREPALLSHVQGHTVGSGKAGTQSPQGEQKAQGSFHGLGALAQAEEAAGHPAQGEGAVTGAWVLEAGGPAASGAALSLVLEA